MTCFEQGGPCGLSKSMGNLVFHSSQWSASNPQLLLVRGDSSGCAVDFPSCFFLGFHSGQWLGRRFHYGRRAQMRLHHCTCLKITTHPSITQGIPHPLQGRYSTVSHAISGRSYLFSINLNCLESSHFPISSIVVVGEIVISSSFYYLFFSVHC